MADEVERLIRDLNGIPKDLRKRLRPKLREAGRVVADNAKVRSAWSTRIPRAIRVSTSFTLRRPGVSVVVNRNKAPHGRPYEDVPGRGSFRHPVFGRDVWVTQKARPFLAPALAAKGDEAGRRIAEAVDEAARDAGFH